MTDPDHASPGRVVLEIDYRAGMASAADDTLR